MKTKNREIWLALVAVLIISVIYVANVTFTNAIPAASDFFGHSIGILGFVLMLMTETLYSLRKRSRSARWGRTAEWLRFHIFTGLVGPYLVLLHTSWKFNGLAGVVTLMTVIVVISGFIGRYIYTAVPRTADGIEVESEALEQEIEATDEKLRSWSDSHPELASLIKNRLAQIQIRPTRGWRMVMGRSLSELAQFIRWKWEDRELDVRLRKLLRQVENLILKRQALERQKGSLVLARRMLAVWHSIHIPIGMAMFTAAFVHIIAALYYGTLLR